MAFLNRQREMGILHRAWTSGKAELLVMYGRRRVGKSALLTHFFADKPHVYYAATRKVVQDQLVELSDQVRRMTQDSWLEQQPFASWDALFGYLATWAGDQRVAVILDEFQYLVLSDPSLPSVIQRWWDQRGMHSQVCLILCGSHVSFMEKVVLAGPELYGRRTRQYQVAPFDYRDAALFFPRYDPQDRIRAYAILGGMPAYLARFTDDLPLIDNLRHRFLPTDSFLNQEATWLLLEELREPRVHSSILRAIAHGRTRPGEIAAAIGLHGATAVMPYLSRLLELRLIERTVPVTESHELRGRRSVYALADNYLAFWYRFVDPYQSLLQAGMVDRLLEEKVLPELDSYVSRPFEETCRQFLWRAAGEGRLRFSFTDVGSWWDDKDEIDVVAMDGRQVVLVGECKWTAQAVGLGDLDRLREKALRMKTAPGVQYALFSRSGFDPRLLDVAGPEGPLLYSVEDMFRLSR